MFLLVFERIVHGEKVTADIIFNTIRTQSNNKSFYNKLSLVCSELSEGEERLLVHANLNWPDTTWTHAARNVHERNMRTEIGYSTIRYHAKRTTSTAYIQSVFNKV
jgi:hypothetical protein